jgi:hypothetical protein
VSGTLLAKAGATSGNGGRIETSGYLLGTTGIRVNASAPKGVSGEWLLDPDDLTIEQNGAETNLNGNFYTPISFSAKAIEDTLNNMTSVSIVVY